jgi:hypothetical protein
MFENQGRKRFAVYKKNKFEIEDININIETNNSSRKLLVNQEDH